MKTFLFTSLALIAFAGNSVLCRLALGQEAIDASSFTAIRLLSGIVVLLVILKVSNSRTRSISSANPSAKGSWLASLMLFVYAACFSFAYISLETGIGALILFGFVQVTMIASGMLTGNKLTMIEMIGVLLAFSGLVYLLLPGSHAPPLFGFLLMAVSGVAWGFYSLLGRASTNPLADTAFNFYRTLPAVLILAVLSIHQTSLTIYGIILAVLSGALASGIGYAVWYRAIRDLSSTQAAVVQLLVPVIAAVGGVLFAAEALSMRLIISSLLILGGILAVVLGKHTLAAKNGIN